MKILIFLPNYIGDILMTTPAIRFLKNNFSEAEIVVVVKNGYENVISENKHITKIITKYDRFNLAKKIISEKPDVCILFRTTFFNSLLSYITKAKFSIGFDNELSKLFLKKVIRTDICMSYRYECFLLAKNFLENFLEKKNLKEENLAKIDFFGYDKEEIKNSLEQKLKIKGIGNEIITINPVASRRTKVLFLRQIIELIKNISQTFPKKDIVIIGTNSSKSYVEKIISEVPDIEVKNLSGELNLYELGYLLKISKLFITPDSGPAFISQAVGTKTLIYFTSTLPEKYGPYSDNVEIFYTPVSCSPCYRDVCKVKDKHKCIKTVDVGEISNIAKNMLVN